MHIHSIHALTKQLNQTYDHQPKTKEGTVTKQFLHQFSLRLEDLAQAREVLCSSELLSPRRELE